MSNATQLTHYSNYPMCGFCYNAWDIVYGRTRSQLSPAQWADMCPHGGCDPMIWDYMTDETGWPEGWDLDDHNVPLAYSKPDKFKLTVPDYDNRVFHMRKDSAPTAQWRATSQRLLKECQRENERDNKSRSLENIFDEEDDEAPPPDVVAALDEDLAAADLWD